MAYFGGISGGMAVVRLAKNQAIILPMFKTHAGTPLIITKEEDQEANNNENENDDTKLLLQSPPESLESSRVSTSSTSASSLGNDWLQTLMELQLKQSESNLAIAQSTIVDLKEELKQARSTII